MTAATPAGCWQKSSLVILAMPACWCLPCRAAAQPWAVRWHAHCRHRGTFSWAAVLAVRQQPPARLVGAVPVGPEEACLALRDDAHEGVCAASPQPCHAVGLRHKNFPQASDAEISSVLAQLWRARGDRYSELRTINTNGLSGRANKVEMSYIGG